MRTLGVTLSCTAICAVSCFSLAATTPAHGADNTLSAAEAAGGWKLLFDGTTTSELRGYRQAGFPAKGWRVEDGAIRVLSGGGGGDLVSKDQYGDFELSLEFKCAPKANSGVMYRVTEANDTPWQTGPEYQVFDDAGNATPSDHKHSAGALYDIIAPPKDKPLRGAGEWNHARIRLKDGLLQHWLNGAKVAEARTDSQAWKDMIAASKFKAYTGFGVQPKGHIALQDHGDDVWFKNIKVRDLDAALPAEVALFNGKDTNGWTAHLNDNGSLEQVWSVADGVLTCKGQPAGYIRTVADYTNYVLKLEWRFNPDKAGNSGVLLRMIGEDKVWPKSIEAQLQSGAAGDFWNIENFTMTAAADRTKGRNTKRTHTAERPLGEWNEYEIIMDGGTVVLKVNGEELNRATDAAAVPGKICLQSEGAEIQFRRIRLSPLGK